MSKEKINSSRGESEVEEEESGKENEKEEEINSTSEQSEEEEEVESREKNEKVEESEQESTSNEDEESKEEETDKENAETYDADGNKSAAPDLNRKKKMQQQQPAPQNQQLQESNKKRKYDLSPTASAPKHFFGRIWSYEDEVVLLEGLSELKGKNGDDHNFFDFIKTKLQFDFTENQVKDKVRKLKTKYFNNCNKPETKRRSHHPLKLEVNRLSQAVWGGGGGGTQLLHLDCCTQQATNGMQQNGSSESIGERPILNSTILNASNPLEKTLKDMWELLPDSKKSKITALWWKRKMHKVQIYHDQQRLESEWANGVHEALNAP